MQDMQPKKHSLTLTNAYMQEVSHTTQPGEYIGPNYLQCVRAKEDVSVTIVAERLADIGIDNLPELRGFENRAFRITIESM